MRTQVVSGGLLTLDDDDTTVSGQPSRDRRFGDKQNRQNMVEKQAAAELSFRIKQAELARELLSDEIDESTREIALKVIELFPTVVPTDLRRTRTAEREVLNLLGLTHENEVGEAFSHARDALGDAFNKLRASKR